MEIRSLASLNKLTAMVGEDPDIGRKVEHLRVCFNNEMYDFKSSELILLLPNIRTIFCTGPEWPQLIMEENFVYPWNKQIEYINEYPLNSITGSLLLSNFCPNLTRIILDHSYDNIIPLLKNAPALRSLTLRVGNITLGDLDTIHENVPCLESFTADGLKLKGSELSQGANPAILVTELHFDHLAVENLETRKHLLAYASKKYPSLSIFTCTFFPVRFNNDGIDKITASDWSPLLRNVGPQLKKFSLCNNGWVDHIFEILDKTNCQIEYLKTCRISNAAYRKIAESQQTLYIQTLIVHDVDFQNYHWLNNLQALKKLKIAFLVYREKIFEMELNKIINNSPPTLRSLSLYNVQLITDPNYAGVSNIESLSFGQIAISRGTDEFISRHFPKLSNLKLKSCFVIGGLFNLEKKDLLNFSYLSIGGEDVNILIVTSGTKEYRWYSVRNTSHSFGISIETLDRVFYPSVKPRPQNKTDTEPHFTLLCNSLNTSFFL